MVKAIKINQIKPKAIFMGSSGVARGLTPDHEVFSNQEPVYNLGILGANAYELKRYFQYATNNNNVETAVVSLDFYAFNQLRDVRPGFSDLRLSTKYMIPQDLFGLYFSFDSLNLIFNPDARGLYFATDGTYERHLDKDKIDFIFEVEILEDFSREEDMYWAYELSDMAIDDYREMINLSNQQGVDIKLFIPPLHSTLFYAAMISGHWSSYEEWFREVVSVQPVWDFSGCSSVTTEAIGVDMQNFEDPSHYSPEIGKLVLNRMFNYQAESVPDDFGVYVTPDNVDQHLKQVRAQCDQWEENSPEVVRWVKSLELSGQSVSLQK
ncbi:MAG: hypothetical protein QNJ46_02210 [Leptolyngbyaceae cyanobacterium MO_188.B28]|nr:hypothetical protein [Leptolyngbyaceae cyanobacterium MO_188.B28]